MIKTKGKKYQIIGGQYEYIYYGESDTLRGAKLIAAHNVEFWDNWQGWRRPRIYRVEDTIVITNRRGQLTRVPSPQDVDPIA